MTTAFSLVALGMAQVGVLSRGVLRQVMHRNRWALAPLLEVEATAPPDHVLHSILRRQRWWEKVCETGLLSLILISVGTRVFLRYSLSFRLVH